MKTKVQDKCGECGAERMVRFENEAFLVEHRGETLDVEGLAGWKCGECGEIEFESESATRYGKAGDELVLRARRREGEEIKRIRKKLGLSQVEAAHLTGGGHNAFSRYERGEAVPLASVINLLKLLDRHPDLLGELKTG